MKDFFSFITAGLAWWEIVVYVTWIGVTIALLISFVIG